jgi:type I restriction enzyme R subunit
MVPIDEAIDKMKEELDIVRGYLNGIKYEKWNKLGSGDLAKLMQKSINQVTTNSETGKVDEEKKEEFLKHATKLFKLFALIMPHKAANSIRDEVAFIQAVKKSINKRTNAPAVDLSEKLESEVKQLISKSISAGEVVDIFEMKGKDKPDFSIFSDKFLKEVKEMEHKNVAIQVLDKLINDEIKLKKKKNVLRYQSLTDSLRDLLDKYENNLIKTAEVIEKLVELAKEVREVESEGEQLGLSDEEKAFYDAVAQGKEKVKNDEELVGIAKEVALAIQKDLTVDWTNQEMIKARIRSNVKKVLLREDFEIEKIEIVMDKVMRQASSLYSDWVPSEKERHVYE